ncbi:MAG: outer membrane protein assembly factor [Alphaproteobacteria bacterium]|nr:outer membrane protein assembly factor [Alphaproteobacteria bacterium]
MRLLKLCLACCCVWALVGCKTPGLPSFLGGEDPDSLVGKYALEGLQDDEEAKAFVQSILDNRLAQIELPEDPDERLRQKEYAEKMITGEVLKAAHSKGYYDAVVTLRAAGGEDATGKNGMYNIRPGPQYKISGITAEPPEYTALLEGLELKPGTALESAAILKAQVELQQEIAKGKCYFSLKVRNRVVLDKNEKTGSVVLVIEASEEATFGEVAFEGQETLKESYLRKLVKWRKGDCFDRTKIDSSREAFLGTGLFSRAEASLPETVPAGGVVPVTMVLKERAQRSIKAGATYYTDEGLGLVLGWEHRNFFGAAEKLTADLNLSLLEQSLELEMNKPFFMRKDQSLTLKAGIERLDTDAYQELGIGGGLRVNRQFGHHLTASVGSDIKITNIDEESGKKKTFGLISGPSSLTYDNRDDTLDPHKGFQARAVLEPFVDAFGKSDPFLKMQLSASHYLSITDSLIWANRVNIGSIAGSDSDSIPATERFFSGGGGSVRGFAYQDIGPKEDGDPIGGRSLTEFSTEFRYKFTDTMGMVAFIDAGQVSEKISPEVTDLSVGAGLGFRYYTDFGPLRFDIATPLTDKDTVDSNFQVYISIGQAF